MAKQTFTPYVRQTKVRRRGKPHPLNVRKSLGPKSSWKGMRKKRRGQG